MPAGKKTDLETRIITSLLSQHLPPEVLHVGAPLGCVHCPELVAPLPPEVVMMVTTHNLQEHPALKPHLAHLPPPESPPESPSQS